jgi:dTDP-4-amino-4,6-dideoxygalactose transaminase
MPRLDDDVARRRELVQRYREQLAEVPGLTIPWSNEDVERGSHFGFAILLESEDVRACLSRELANHGIQTTHYPAISSLSAYHGHPAPPRAKDLAARHLLLPLSSVFTDRDVDLVAEHVTDSLAARAAPAG